MTGAVVKSLNLAELEGIHHETGIAVLGEPDAVVLICDFIAEGDLVVGRYILRGIHQGEFFGIPATGKSITVSNIHIMRLADGKIVEHWGHGDDMGMMRQLGAMP